MNFNPSKVKKIAIFRALQIGDLLCTIPAIRALRNGYPSSEITLISLPWAKHLVQRYDNYFDSFIEFPGFPGLPEQPFNPSAFLHFLGEVQEKKFDLVLQMQGNGSVVNPLIELFGSKYTAGFYKQDHYYPSTPFYVEYPETGHEIEHHLLLIRHLEIPIQGKHLEFPLFDQDFVDLERAGVSVDQHEYVCIHPGARGESRRWSAEHYARLADLVAVKGFKPVITGTKDELTIVNEVAEQMKQKPEIAAGKTSLGAVAALIQNSYGLISNCTGVSHIAAALKKRSIVISLEKEIERWAPLNKDLHKVINWSATPSLDLVLEETGSWLRP
jgi:ADP-heptose:LPS heptosyltransferase